MAGTVQAQIEQALGSPCPQCHLVRPVALAERQLWLLESCIRNCGERGGWPSVTNGDLPSLQRE